MTDPVILDLVLEGQVGDRYFSMVTARYPDHVPVGNRYQDNAPADGPKATLIGRATDSDGRQVARYQLPDGWTGTALFGDWRRDPDTGGMYLAHLVVDGLPLALRLRACPHYSTDPGSEHIPDDEPDTCAGCGGTPTTGPSGWCPLSADSDRDPDTAAVRALLADLGNIIEGLAAIADQPGHSGPVIDPLGCLRGAYSMLVDNFGLHPRGPGGSLVALTAADRSDCALGLTLLADQWDNNHARTAARRRLAQRLDPLDPPEDPG
jgi:hypothetical protein